MRTIRNIILCLGILFGSISAAWADTTAEKQYLESYFSTRGTDYISVLDSAAAHQALRDSVNTLYHNSFAVIDTVGADFIFQGFFTLDGVKPTIAKVDTLYFAPEVADYFGDSAISVMQATFRSILPMWRDELMKCSEKDAPARQTAISRIRRQWPNPLDSLPYRKEGIDYALCGGINYYMQRLLADTTSSKYSSDPENRALCILNSDVNFKVLARMIEAFRLSNIYNQAKQQPLIYDVPLRKAQRLAELNRDNHDILYFVALKGNDTVRLDRQGTQYAQLNAQLEYSRDRMVWKNYNWNEQYGDTIVLPAAGDTVFFRAGGAEHKNAFFSFASSMYYHFAFGANDSIAAGGNIMSLYDASCEQNSMTDNGFFNLFSASNALYTAPSLPATHLAYYCYASMFLACPHLTAAPALPADTLEYGCYYGMFNNCGALTQAPSLNIKQLAGYCFYFMFNNCAKLSVDTLSATCEGTEMSFPTEAENNWNSYMFNGCHVYDNVQVGGHYCISEWKGPHAMQISVANTELDTIYTGEAYPLEITYTHPTQVDGIVYIKDGVVKDTLPSGMEILYSYADSTLIQLHFFAKDYKDTTIDIHVNIRPREVIMTSGAASKVYDGTPLTNSEVTITGNGFISGEGATYDVTGSQTQVGKSINAFTYTLNEGTKARNYRITTIADTLRIRPRSVTPIAITIDNHEKMYDGTPLSATYTYSGALQQGDYLNVTLDTYERTDAGTDSVRVSSFAIYDAEGMDMTEGYNVANPISGSLKVTPREVVLTSGDAEKAFDGTALTNTEVVVPGDGFAAGEGASFDVTGSQTKVGESANSFSYTLNEGTKADNYLISTVEGTLTVNYRSTTPISVTVDNREKLYDGTPLFATYTYSGSLMENDLLEVTMDHTERTDVGEDAVQVTDLKIMSAGMDMTEGYIVANPIAGSLKVTPREVIMTSGDAEKLFDGTALTNTDVTITGDGFAVGEGASFDVTGSQTKVGESVNAFSYTLNEGTKAGNYLIYTVEGTLMVYCNIEPQIIGMYDQWNIVLDVKALTDTLAAYGVAAELQPENVTWYANDEPASPATGFFHTEDKHMEAVYYAIVYVPEAKAVMGIDRFRSNTLYWVAPTAPARNTTEKRIENNQLIIIRDGKKFNAQGIAL